jgi:hypothetical protein
MAFSIRAGLGALSMFTASLEAQPVLLQIKPRLGDTLWVNLAQQVEMTGLPRGCGNQASALRAPAKITSSVCTGGRSMTTTMEVFSRAIARHSTRNATDMIAITDSVVTSSPGPNSKRMKQPTPRGPVEIRISTDGTVELGAGQASDELRALFGQMPATLPTKAISVGEKWLHQMKVPLPNEPGAMALVKTTLQLDSLGKGGDIAYISLRGALSHDHSDGRSSETSGTLTGTMQLNRRMNWITETHATIDVWAVVNNVSSGQPMDVHTRVVQTLKVK